MHHETIERVLSCDQLPSLAGVAARVVELTSNPEVDLRDLAETIQHDQALSTKVLRTINSSHFGLRNKCTTISHALAMLGLSSVKCLALGFCLVDTLSIKREDGFDYVAFWRRGIYSGVGAKLMAEAIGSSWTDEAVLGGLLQDIGVIAMYRALGAEYADVVESTKGDHRKLVARELGAFEVQHPEIGAMLAERWRLPEELVLPIRYHERPTAAPGPVAVRVRAIALGNMMHDVLTDMDPVPALADYVDHASQWFGFERGDAHVLLERLAEAAHEVAGLFQLDTGGQPSATVILEEAERRLVEVTRLSGRSVGSAPHGPHSEDPLTGLMTRVAFDELVDAALDRARREGDSLVLMLFSVDGLEAIRGAQGDDVADGALVAMRDAITATARAFRVGRYSDDAIGAIARGASREEAERRGAAAREALRTPAHEHIRLSIGIVAVGRGQAGAFATSSALEAAALRAMDAARVAGGDCERTFVARAAA